MRSNTCKNRPAVRTRPALSAVVLGFIVTAVAPASNAPAQELNSDVQRFINNAKLANARVGVCVMDASSGETLVSIRSSEKFIPASNLKLVTSGAALLTLGPKFEFKTELLRDGDRLILRGGGDPALGDPAVLARSEPKLDTEDVLATLVKAARAAGIERISEVVIDDRIFDRVLVHPAWPQKHLHHGYGAQVSGLNFHANVLHIFAQPNPQGPGTRPLVQLDPAAPWVSIAIRGQTVSQSKNSAWVTRDANSNAFTLYGEVGTKSVAPIEITLDSPAEFTGRLLADRLGSAGVVLGAGGGGEAPGVRVAAPEEQFPQAKLIGVIATPLSEVLQRCNADSENLYAEALLKRVGNAVTREPGSWENGIAVLRMLLSQRLGPEAAAATTLIDGSGLSRDNQISPATLAGWLVAMAEEESGEMFVESLAAPGKKGTLERRFAGAKLKNEVRGKSGFINGVRALSGYVTHPGTGRRVVYCVMVNNITTGDQTEDSRKLHEHVVKVADEWLTKRAEPSKPRRGG